MRGQKPALAPLEGLRPNAALWIPGTFQPFPYPGRRVLPRIT